MATTKRKPGEAQHGKSRQIFSESLAGMSEAKLTDMQRASQFISRAFLGLWGDIPIITLKEFIGAVDDELETRGRKR